MSLQYFKDFTKAYTYLLQSVKKNVTENLSKKCKLLQNVHCCCSVTQSRPTFCDPRDRIMLGFPVLHHLPELAQTHVQSR